MCCVDNEQNFDFCCYLNYRNKQFAVVENPGFWDWTFTLKDENDNVLAQINRDWRGLGLEVFSFLLLDSIII